MTKMKRPLIDAKIEALRLVKLLTPYCSRIEIAGSIRRGVEQVSDIELVAIPMAQEDLFGYPMEELPLTTFLTSLTKLSKNGPKYKQFRHMDYQVDLFLATPDNWGYIFMLRTGPRKYSKYMVTSRNKGGFKPYNIAALDGSVYLNDKLQSIPEETDLYALWGLPWLEPSDCPA